MGQELRILKARDFALQAHAGQKYGDGRPFIVHPEHVVSVVQKHGCAFPFITLAAAWLHDVLEDCPQVKPSDIGTEFGADVLAIVEFCTDEKGVNRRDRKAKTFRPEPCLIRKGSDKCSA